MAPAGARIFTEHENKLLIVLGKHAAKGSGTLSGALALKAEFEEILEELHDDLKKKHEEEFERETEHYGKTTDGSWLKQREEQVEAANEADYIQQRSSLMDLLLSWFGDVGTPQAGSASSGHASALSIAVLHAPNMVSGGGWGSGGERTTGCGFRAGGSSRWAGDRGGAGSGPAGGPRVA